MIIAPHDWVVVSEGISVPVWFAYYKVGEILSEDCEYELLQSAKKNPRED